jgi:putative DNA primase/helicase
VQADALVRTVPRVGWYFGETDGAAFVLPNHVCGPLPSDEPLVLTQDPPPLIYRAQGTADAWRASIGRLSQGNTRLVFAVSLAFVGALLAALGGEGGGFHLRGDSSQGKTTALHAAASVWGSPLGQNSFVRAWRATGNALEAVASAHSDTLLPLDEIGQCEPREAAQIVYMLAHGRGKERMRDRGGLRKTAAWRVLILSSGEEAIGDLLARAGRPVKAGQEARLLDFPANAGAGLGLFDVLHGAPDGDAFAREIRSAAQANFGTAGPAFLDWFAPRIAHGGREFEDSLKRRVRAVAAAMAPVGAESQVLRAAGRFALAGC